jgi:GT2 family glycosyltransferase
MVHLSLLEWMACSSERIGRELRESQQLVPWPGRWTAMTDLTVLMPTHNRASVLRTTLEALCRVRAGTLALEIVVIDNGSSDDTQHVLREYAQRLPLRQIYEPKAGKSNALNRALCESTLGEIVLFTDDDVTPDASWFEAVVATCQRWPEHSVFGGRIDPAWPQGIPVPSWATDKYIQAIAFSAHHISDREGHYPPTAEPFGPNFWVRRAALGGVRFRSDLGPHPTRRTLGDESEFLRQLRRKGFDPIYSPSARVAHRIEPERTTETALFRRALQSGRGTVHVVGMPEATLLERSRAAWQLRIASNVGISAVQLLAAALEPEERLRFNKVFGRAVTFAKNLEALRWSVSTALERARKRGVNRTLPAAAE